MDRGPTARELIEGCKGARGVGRALKARAVRDEEADALRIRAGMRRDLQPVGSIAVPADQDSIKAAFVMRLGRGTQVPEVDGGTGGRMDLRLLARLDHADE